MSLYWNTLVELLSTPFQHLALVWGIVPLYFGLLLNELTSSKANFRTAIQTGFSFTWAGVQWLYLYANAGGMRRLHLAMDGTLPINVIVTLVVLGLGVFALICGLRRRFPRHGKFLGHTRFANYFAIMIFPIQGHYLAWTWDRLAAIAIFAVPVWIALHFGLMPLRGR